MMTVEELTVKDAERMMDEGEITSLELTKAYLRRIAELNPKLNAMAEVNPDALLIAEAMDYERKHGEKRSALHGIPVLIKDNIDTGDRMHTTAGSLALQHHYAKEDAFVVKKLREAGAVILGKVNLSEFAGYTGENMWGGHSSRAGKVINPYDSERTPAGSSAGTGVAVSANFCTVGIGTETDGSIIYPSQANNITGLKPTVGLVSRTGIIPISNIQDTAGPMGRTVADVAALLNIMVGIDERDPATWKSKWVSNRDYRSYLDLELAKGKRLGIIKSNLKSLTEEEKHRLEEAEQIYQNHGVEVVELPDTYDFIHEFTFTEVLSHEFKSGINAYLAGMEDCPEIRSLSDVIAFNKEHAEACLSYGQYYLEHADEKTGRLIEPQYLEHRIMELEKAGKDGIDAAMRDYDVDALLMIGCTSAPAKAGYPCISFPGGPLLKDHRGANFTMMSGQFQEPVLFTLAYLYEEVTGGRRVPPVL